MLMFLKILKKNETQVIKLIGFNELVNLII